MVAQRHPIVVVGAGPVGLVAATALSDQGLPVTVVEASPVPQTDWRASTFHAATLEVLERIGVVPDMLRMGLPVPRFQYRDRTEGLIAEFDFGLIADETRYPFRLQLNQQHLVALLFERLRGRTGVTLRFGTRVTGVEQPTGNPAGPVSVLLSGPDGDERLPASFVLGADGPSSTVRRSLGIVFDGMTYPRRFLITSVAEQIDELIPGVAPVAYVSDPREWLFLLRTPESWRVVMPLEEDADDAEVRRPDSVRARLDRVAKAPGGFHLVDTQVYRVHQRVAAEFRRGRVLLAGDAAHINSPLGGMGLNSGIHDAIDLGIRLGRAWDAPAAGIDAELAAYAQRRRRVALDFVGADTHRNTVMMQERDDAVRRANQDDLRATAADPDRARQWLMRASLVAAVRSHGIGTPPSPGTA
jgi:3-(3-hydroxy-phenyl)propionate hydroxylase